ncbi:MAG: hypothetical protein AMXMBFR82_42740 [Candidatus Hydrogenedentota bacterium]
MSRIRSISRVPFNEERIPARAYLPETDSERYKACLEEQTTLGGKVGCFVDYMVALSDKSQL